MPTLTKVSDFERTTRNLRWLYVVALLTFPHVSPQIYVIAFLLPALILFNLTRYWPAALSFRTYASPILVLAVDNVFIGLLISLVGTTNTPYTAFLLFLVISATYKYGLRGAVTVASLQTLWLFVILKFPLFPPIVLPPVQNLVVSAFDLLGLGLLAERLTHSDRLQRQELERLGRENAAERSRLLTLVNSIQDAVFLLDSHGNVIQYNEMAASLAGRQYKLTGKPFDQILPLRSRAAPSQEPVELLKGNTGPQRRRDLIYMAEHGIVYDLEIQVTPVMRGSRKGGDFVIVCRDITKEHTLDEQRKEFISVASHELRTPLTIMEAALSTALLDSSKLPKDTVTLLQQVHRNTVFLAGIIKDLSLLNTAENDNLPIELKEVNAQPLLAQLLKDFAIQAKQRGLALKSNIATNTPAIISTEHHIYEILQNYINNALKYTSAGSITVSAAPSTNGGILFSVQDTGIGISPSDQKRLFTKFFRAEDYRTRKTGGTGLGLYLCQELAQRINARVWCQSKLNEGSTFYLEVPPFSQLSRDNSEVAKAQVSALVKEL